MIIIWSRLHLYIRHDYYFYIYGLYQTHSFTFEPLLFAMEEVQG